MRPFFFEFGEFGGSPIRSPWALLSTKTIHTYVIASSSFLKGRTTKQSPRAVGIWGNGEIATPASGGLAITP